MVLTSGLEIPTDRIAAICRRYYVRELGIFGSMARGDAREDSDIDLLVEFQPDAPIGLFEFDDLERELASTLDRRVDLVSKRGLKSRVRGEVLADLKVIYAA